MCSSGDSTDVTPEGHKALYDEVVKKRPSPFYLGNAGHTRFTVCFSLLFFPTYQREFLAECLSCRFQKPACKSLFFSVFFFCCLIQKKKVFTDMATFSSAGLTIQSSFKSRPRRGQQQSQDNSYAWEMWKLGYGISEECVDLQRKEHPLGLKMARYNNKRDGKGVFPVPH